MRIGSCLHRSGYFVVLVLVVFVFGCGKQETRMRKAQPEDQSGELGEKESQIKEAATAQPGVTFKPFDEPAKCIEIPLKLGLKPGTGPKPTWKDLGLGWMSTTKMQTHTGRFRRVGDVDNDITCLFYSEKQDFVQYVRVTANCFNKDGESTTLTKFRAVLTGLVQELGIPDAVTSLASIPPDEDSKLDGKTYTIEFKREKYEMGYGWTFTLTTK